jgi:hypothetical protein
MSNYPKLFNDLEQHIKNFCNIQDDNISLLSGSRAWNVHHNWSDFDLIFPGSKNIAHDLVNSFMNGELNLKVEESNYSSGIKGKNTILFLFTQKNLFVGTIQQRF